MTKAEDALALADALAAETGKWHPYGLIPNLTGGKWPCCKEARKHPVHGDALRAFEESR